ncbi:MAG: VENN motif pre-toxin domain-containing protein [Azoarcus sp.]|nr:VENN motif pre-toxin domain-containing protein [Azoarcus sp.]
MTRPDVYFYGNEQEAIDPVTGQFNANLLLQDKKLNIVALSEVVGVLAGGIADGSLAGTHIGANIAQNAVENN